MAQVDVVWYGDTNGENHGWWDQTLIKDTIENSNLESTYYEGIKKLPEYSKGAIVIVPTRLWTGRETELSDSLQRLGFVLLILCGDEEATFNWRLIKHVRMAVWVMMPRMNVHDDTVHIPNGYRPDTRKYLREAGYKEKTQDWIFAGQVTHERREQLVQELVFLKDSGRYPNGRLETTKTFGEEIIPYKTYVEELVKTKIALCPSGPESPDSFRLYEALEAGCLPVVDAFSTNFKTHGFWEYMFGEKPPFPIVDYWDALPKLMPELLKGYPENANKCYAWWQKIKYKLVKKLEKDIQELTK